MDYETTKSVLLDRLAVAEGTLKEGDLKGLSHKKTLMSEFLASGALVLVGGMYRAEGALLEGLEARRQAILARQKAERIEAERVQAEAARLATERDVEQKRIANAMNGQKHTLSQRMDALLCRAKLQQKKTCKSCGKALAPLSSERFCDRCYETPYNF